MSLLISLSDDQTQAAGLLLTLENQPFLELSHRHPLTVRDLPIQWQRTRVKQLSAWAMTEKVLCPVGHSTLTRPGRELPTTVPSSQVEMGSFGARKTSSSNSRTNKVKSIVSDWTWDEKQLPTLQAAAAAAATLQS